MSLGTVMPAPKFTGLDSNGDPVAGGFLYTYAAGTLTALATYNNADLDPSHANANPVELDAAGRATVFLSAATYKFVLKTSADVTVWTVDGVAASSPFEANLDVPGTAGEALSSGEVVYLSTGAGGTTAGRWYKADADAAATSSTANAIGMIPDAIASGAEGSIRLQGRIEGLVGLTPGAPYYVSATAGALTATPPVNVRFVGAADSATSLVMTATLNGGVGVFSSLTVTGNATVGGTLLQTGVATFTAAPVLSALTASQAVFTDGSKALTSNAITGTGNVVMSASPTLTGTITAAAITASGVITGNGGFTGNLTGNITGTAPAGTLTGTTLAANVVTSSITTVGALNSGSITSGFGSIDVGADSISGGAISGTTGTYSGDLIFTANNSLRMNTSDGSDTGALGICGGGAASVSRGSLITVVGNENGAPGIIQYLAGNVSGGHHLWYTGNAVERMRLYDSGGFNVGSTPSDPGANNLRVQGTSALVGAVTCTSTLTVNGGTASVVGAEGGSAVININADEGDDAADRWAFTAADSATGDITLTNAAAADQVFAFTAGLSALFRISNSANGTGAKTGNLVNVGRNSSGSGAAGCIGLIGLGGTQYYLWVDATGDLRIGPDRPTENGSVSDTSGTVVGTQS